MDIETQLKQIMESISDIKSNLKKASDMLGISFDYKPLDFSYGVLLSFDDFMNKYKYRYIPNEKTWRVIAFDLYQDIYAAYLFGRNKDKEPWLYIYGQDKFPYIVSAWHNYDIRRKGE